MSRYEVDKVLRQVVLDDAALQAHREDPVAFLQGRELTDAESDAIAGLDYRTLYSAGAHPFLLNGFVMRASSGERRTVLTEYLAGIKPLGYPDFST